jgi:hypothetical protein
MKRKLPRNFCKAKSNKCWQQLRLDAHFFIPGLADSSSKDEHFFKAPRESR